MEDKLCGRAGGLASTLRVAVSSCMAFPRVSVLYTSIHVSRLRLQVLRSEMGNKIGWQLVTFASQARSAAAHACLVEEYSL